MNKEEITKEDVLNVTCNISDTFIDYVGDSNEELEQLQQENKQLKEEKLKYGHLIAENYRLEHNERVLSERIDKAIEYITTERLYTNYQWSKEQYQKILNDLLEILKGDSNER